MVKLRERDYWLGFNLFPGIGPVRFNYLLKKFGSADKAWTAGKTKLLNTNLPHSLIANFIEFRSKIDLYREIIRVEKSLIKYTIVEDKDYPSNLKKIPKPPPLIYYKGNILPQDSYALAVVGTRKISPYGMEVTERLVTDLIYQGFTIVSGLARGVDGLAHRLALGNKGRTLAVLGSGLDNIYPPEHKSLADKIVASGQGAIISQLPLGTGSLKGHFPSRNRLIAGLSLGVLVTEGASKSGAKITCQYAKEQNKPVFAVPGPITSSLSEGPADLIKQGAKLVTQIDDVVREIKGVEISRVSRVSRVPRVPQVVKNLNFQNKEQEQIWQLLISGHKHIDELIRLSGQPSQAIMSHLTTMELAGMVKNIGSGNYIII